MLTGRDAVRLLLDVFKVYVLEIKIGIKPDTYFLKDIDELLKKRKGIASVGGDLEKSFGLIEVIQAMVDINRVDKNTLEPTLYEVFEGEDIYLDLFIKAIDDTPSEPLDVINGLKKAVNAILYDIKLTNHITEQAFKISKEKDKKKKFILMEQLQDKLGKAGNTANDDDPSIVQELFGADEKALAESIASAREQKKAAGLLKFGWHGINDMTQGGIRRGETATVGGLSHSFKSGMTLTLWLQTLVNNEPKTIMPGDKKPMAVWVTLEDDLAHVLEFAYNYLWMDEHNELPSEEVDPTEVARYVMTRLHNHGWHTYFLKVDPSDWNYLSLYQVINRLEYDGYEIIVTGVDYLTLIPTTGCNRSGAAGTDVRDLLRRVRNFFNRKKIAFITPLQLSPDALRLLRNGISETDFVKEIAKKSYYSGSSQLMQEIDLELFVHIANVEGKAYLAVHRGKHRLPTTIPENKQYLLLPFPEKGPIASDINKEKPIHIRSIDNVAMSSDFKI